MLQVDLFNPVIDRFDARIPARTTFVDKSTEGTMDEQADIAVDTR
jgi:hypothetical protein